MPQSTYDDEGAMIEGFFVTHQFSKNPKEAANLTCVSVGPNFFLTTGPRRILGGGKRTPPSAFNSRPVGDKSIKKP